MSAAIYLTHKRNKIKSKFHQVIKNFGSTFGLMNKKVTSQLHRELIPTKLVSNNINQLLKKSHLFIENILISKKAISFFFQFFPRILENKYQNNIDWTRCRFSGQSTKIFVKKVQIIEKIFVTSKGNIISVKRHELGLLIR